MADIHGTREELVAFIGHQTIEIERLRNLTADLMDLLREMPIKHPQQTTRRDILYGQCQQFGVCQ